MLAPAATQNRMFRKDEWNSEPSPTFCTMCGRSVYGWSPIHGSPSPPSCVIDTMCRSGCSMIEANEWQPGLPHASSPGRSRVPTLWGHPEQ